MILAAVVVVVFFVLIKKKGIPTATESRDEVASADSPAPTQLPKENVLEATMDAQALVSREARKASLRMAASGFAAIALTEDNPTLNYNVLPYERKCLDGDLDIIKYDLQFSGFSTKDLLFSLEPVANTRRSTSAQYQNVSFEDLMNSFKGSFKLAPSKEPQVLGLYLCSSKGGVRDKRRPCGRITNFLSILDLINMQKQIVSNPQQSALRERYPKSPKIFFFQMLLVGPWGVYIYENNPTLPFKTDLMRKALNVDKYPYLAKEMNYGISLMEKIASMPPMVSGNNITLVLPHRGDCPLIGQPNPQD
ncbi:MAG: hypothetical protein ACOH5I_23220 [Oligoflexus sp.]